MNRYAVLISVHSAASGVHLSVALVADVARSSRGLLSIVNLGKRESLTHDWCRRSCENPVKLRPSRMTGIVDHCS